MFLFICTNDPKYRDVKKKMKSAEQKSQTAIVSMIAAAVGASISMAAGALVPLCALVLLVTLKMGKNAFCATTTLNFKVQPIKPEVKAERKGRAKVGT
jgi:hypothetical protein